MAKRKNITVDTQYMGPEPTWENVMKLSEQEFSHKYMNALNWYNYYFDKSKAKAKVLEYLSKFDPDNLKAKDACKKLPDWAFGSTLTSVCTMRLNGCNRSPKKSDGSNEDWVVKKMNELIEQAGRIVEEKQETAKVIQKPVQTLQERVFATAQRQSEGIDEAIDEALVNDYKTDFNTYKYLQKNQVKGAIAKRMIDFYIGEAQELQEALKGEDEQLVEGYSHMTKAELKRFAKLMADIVADIERWVENQKAYRKPRKKKAVPLEKQVAKVKYAKTNEELKLVSIPPEQVVGAMVVWVYNTKYRKLGKYVAGTREGFSFKGTTLQRFDEEQSIQKKLRKPEEVLERCLSGGKIVLRKLMDEIKTKEQKMTGRFNEETIILRVTDL